MSKPGGQAIVKKRPFFEDENIAIFTNQIASKIVSFEFKDKRSEETKVFNVNKQHEIKKAWQELEKHGDRIAYELLGSTRKIRRSGKRK